MLTLEQAMEAYNEGFIIEARAADGEVECVTDALYVDRPQALQEFRWHLDQGHTLIKAGISDTWVNLPF